MKIKHFAEISQEIEVEIGMDQIFDHWHSLPTELEFYWIIDAINTAIGILRRIPDETIAAMSTDRRLLIYNALKEQLKRYETGPVEPGEWKPATPFG